MEQSRYRPLRYLRRKIRLKLRPLKGYLIIAAYVIKKGLARKLFQLWVK